MLLLEQNTTKKKQMDENIATKLGAGDNKSREYKVEAICDSAVYTKKSKSGYLLEFYYLVS